MMTIVAKARMKGKENFLSNCCTGFVEWLKGGPKDPTGHVRNSVNNAIYWAHHTRSFSGAILGPVNHGGDADTIAALAGGIAGARFGADLIPKKWIYTLDPKVVMDLNVMADWLMKN